MFVEQVEQGASNGEDPKHTQHGCPRQDYNMIESRYRGRDERVVLGLLFGSSTSWILEALLPKKDPLGP